MRENILCHYAANSTFLRALNPETPPSTPAQVQISSQREERDARLLGSPQHRRLPAHRMQGLGHSDTAEPGSSVQQQEGDVFDSTPIIEPSCLYSSPDDAQTFLQPRELNAM